MIPALKFSDPETERATYAAAMAATLNDKRGPTLSFNEAIDILRLARYPFTAINDYVDAAIKQANYDLYRQS